MTKNEFNAAARVFLIQGSDDIFLSSNQHNQSLYIFSIFWKVVETIKFFFFSFCCWSKYDFCFWEPLKCENEWITESFP